MKVWVLLMLFQDHQTGAHLDKRVTVPSQEMCETFGKAYMADVAAHGSSYSGSYECVQLPEEVASGGR